MSDGLTESRDRLIAAGLALAVRGDGKARIVQASEPWPAGLAVWTPQEMLDYVGAPDSARRVIRGVKSLRAANDSDGGMGARE